MGLLTATPAAPLAGMVPATLGDSKSLVVGQKVYAIGNPFGLNGTMTRGIINKIAHEPIAEMRRQANDPEGIHLIQTIRKLFRLGEG